MKHRATLYLTVAAAGALISGCASFELHHPSRAGATETRAEERGFVAGSGIESQDIVTVADRMARDILATPEIANTKGAPRIMLLPVKNETRFPINKEVFLERIAVRLNEKSSGKVRFLARDTDPRVSQFKGADFLLTGKLTCSTTRTSAGTSDYVLYSFTLIDPNTSDIVCQKAHEIKKQGLEDAAYR